MKENKTTNNEVTLEWKNHEPFYFSLNKKMDEISETGELCYKNKMEVYNYFAKVQNLCDKHFAYIRNPKEVTKQLTEIQELLHKKGFMKDLNKRDEAAEYLMRIFNRLRKIYTQMVVDFTRPGLIPTPIMKVNEGYEEIKSLKKQKMVKAAMGLFENV